MSKLATVSPVAPSFKKVEAYFGFGLVACQSCSGPMVAVVLLHDCLSGGDAIPQVLNRCDFKIRIFRYLQY